MAWGGPLTVTRIDRFTVKLSVGTLGARVGAPAIAVPDTGEVTTAVPAAFQNGLPSDFGPGRGNWRAEDVDHLEIEQHDQGNAATAGGMYVASGSPRVVLVGQAGDLVVTHHNRGAGVAGPVLCYLKYRRKTRPVSSTGERS